MSGKPILLADDAPLDDPEDFQRRNLVLYNLLGMVDDLFVRLDGRVPNPKRRSISLATFVILSFLVTILLLVTGGGFRDENIVTVALQLYAGFFTFISLLAPELIQRKVLRFVAAHPGDWNRTQGFWSNMSRSIRMQWLAGLLMLFIAPPVFAYIFFLAFGYVPGWSLWVVVGFLGFVWGLGGYTAIRTSYRFTQYLNPERIPLYPFDPRHSPIIEHLSSVFEFALGASSLTLVFFLLPLVFLRIPFLIYIASAILGLGFVALVALFLFAQRRLAELVGHRRLQVAGELQTKIESIYRKQDHLEKQDFDEMQQLMKLHDSLLASIGWNIGTTRLVFYLRSFILPTILAVIVNFDLLQQRNLQAWIDVISKILANAP